MLQELDASGLLQGALQAALGGGGHQALDLLDRLIPLKPLGLGDGLSSQRQGALRMGDDLLNRLHPRVCILGIKQMTPTLDDFRQRGARRTQHQGTGGPSPPRAPTQTPHTARER